MDFLKLTSAEQNPFDVLMDRARPTDGWNTPGRKRSVLSDFSCSAMLSGCDFEGVTCAVTAVNEDGTLSCSFSAYCKLRKMPKRYRDDRRAGITKPFTQYKRGVRQRDEIELEIRIHSASMNRALHGAWNRCV